MDRPFDVVNVMVAGDCGDRVMGTSPEYGRSVGRTVLLAIAALALVAGMLVSTVQPSFAAGVTTTANLNLRQGPGTSFAISQVVPSGGTVDVTGAAQFGYVPVTYGGATGWVLETYLNLESPASTSGTRHVFDGRLNLRSGPGTSYSVISVMPDGAAVTASGTEENGFARITWNGTPGWAATQYLTATNPDNGERDPSTPEGDDTGTATTTARLYLRSGPSTTYGAFTVIPDSTTIDVTGSAQGDYSQVRYDGFTGWVATIFLTTPEEETPATTSKVTTAALNLRSGPGTTYAAQRVLPPGTAVTVTGAEQNGFLPVSWGSLTGYVSSAWLTDPGSADDPGAAIDGDDDIIAIIYAAADRWGQPRADMLRVARCESNLDPSAVNSSSGASGLFQFMPSTFAFTPNGKRGESIFDAYSSADAAGWMWANGMRNHWECQ